jgi:hypothetical protein
MNSKDPLFRNYMALYLSIVSEHSVTQSLMAVGILGHTAGRASRYKKELKWEDLDREDEKMLFAHDDDENEF